MRYIIAALIAATSVFSAFSSQAAETTTTERVTTKTATTETATTETANSTTNSTMNAAFPCPDTQETQVWWPGEGPQHSNLQTHMFDGITLTELQRQQMRDLMQQMQQDAPIVSVKDAEMLHQLVIADNFDENAVRTLIEQIAHRQTARQIEMAKIRNRMYHLLNQEQQAILAKNHQLRMKRLEETSHMQ